MRKVVLTILVVTCSLMAGNYKYSNSYSNSNDESYKYQGSSGTNYKYDLSKPTDRMNYSMDLDAQMNDRLNAPLNPGVGLDRNLGQYGGGIQSND